MDGSDWQPEEGEQIPVSFDMETLGCRDNEILGLRHNHGKDITVFEVFVVIDGNMELGILIFLFDKSTINLIIK